MVFSSIPFIFIFLPAFFILYYLVPFKLKNYVLLIFSLIFYAYGEPVYIFLMMFSSAVDWLNGLLLSRNPSHRKRYLIIAITINLCLLGFFKYADFFIGVLNGAFHLGIEPLGLALPIGISFYTFQTMSYSIDVYRGEAKPEKNYFYYLMYVSMFPQLIAGPIVRYQTVADEIRQRTISVENFEKGMIRFLLGLFKKVLIANSLGEMFKFITAEGELNASLAWLALIAFTLQIFFDFSGYSDMAIGLGQMMGFHFLENFNYPYIANSVTDFWRRWHISLSTWFRDYVYIPLGGNRVKIGRHIFNLLFVWFLTGFWHGANYNFIIWGLYYGVLLVLEKYVYGRYLEKAAPFFRHVYSLFFIMIGWAVFAFEDIKELMDFIPSLFGKYGAASTATLYYLGCYLVPLVAGIILSTPIVRNYLEKKHGKCANILLCVAFAALFIISVAALVTDTYNPFLYFRF